MSRQHDCYHAVMAQLTIRVSEELAAQLKNASAASGRSVNGWVAAVLTAAVDPETATDEANRVRERLARAGILAASEPGPTRRRPDADAFARARAAAGQGRPIADFVSEGRG